MKASGLPYLVPFLQQEMEALTLLLCFRGLYSGPLPFVPLSTVINLCLYHPPTLDNARPARPWHFWLSKTCVYFQGLWVFPSLPPGCSALLVCTHSSQDVVWGSYLYVCCMDRCRLDAWSGVPRWSPSHCRMKLEMRHESGDSCGP